MGFLLGLPLKLLALVFGLLRVLIPVLLLILVVRWLWRKYGGHRRSESAKKDEPVPFQDAFSGARLCFFSSSPELYQTWYNLQIR